MKPVIAIPSYNNPNSPLFSKLAGLGLDVYVYVRKEQYDAYAPIKQYGITLVKLSNVSEIGMTRNCIMRHLHSKGIVWAFMFDDDISKVEQLGYRTEKQRWDAERIINGSLTGPSVEKRALQLWYQLAKTYDLSLSSPAHRTSIGSKGSTIHVNKHPCIQCVLVKVPDVIAVGNYKSIHETGNEDYYIQYSLMDAGCLTGTINLIEYDCPPVGNCPDGTSEDMKTKYRRYIKAFQTNVCNDRNKMTTKVTKTGFDSLQFNWKYWNGFVIDIP